MPQDLNYTIDFLSNEWIRNNIISFCIIAILIYLGKKLIRYSKIHKYFPLFIGIFLLLRVFGYQWYHYKIGIWNIAISLPLHLCSFSSILSGIILITVNNKNIKQSTKQLLFDFMFYWGLAGLYAFITPQYTAGIQGYLYYDYYISHGGFIFAIFYLIYVHGYTPSKNSFLRVFIQSQFILIIIHIINYMIGWPANYMYTTMIPVAENPFVIGNNEQPTLEPPVGPISHTSDPWHGSFHSTIVQYSIAILSILLYTVE